MTTTFRVAAAISAAIIFLLAGCGGGSGTGTQSGSGPAPLQGFTDPAQPQMAALNSLYSGYSGATPTAGDSFTPQLFLVIDASGRFYGSITSVRADSTPFSENAVIGTLTASGNQWTSTGASMLYRAASSTTFSTGTVNLVVSLGPEIDAAGKLMMHATFSGATLPMVATDFELEAVHIGYAPTPIALPNGSYFNAGTLSIDGATGRVQGLAAAGCGIDGILGMTDPGRNVLRLRATFAGPGCAAAHLPEATGEFLGYVYVGPNYISGTGLQFFGMTNSQSVSLFIDSRTF